MEYAETEIQHTDTKSKDVVEPIMRSEAVLIPARKSTDSSATGV